MMFSFLPWNSYETIARMNISSNAGTKETRGADTDAIMIRGVVMLRNLPEGHAGRHTGRADCHVNSNMSKRSCDPAWRDLLAADQSADGLPALPPFTPTPPAESCQLLCIWRRARCILLLHKIKNIKVKKYEKEGKRFQNASGVCCWPTGRPEPSRQTQAFICRTQLCRQMTIFARYHCALNFSLSAIWAKIITPPSHSSNSNGSALVPILSVSSEVFRPVRNLKNAAWECLAGQICGHLH